MYGGINQNVCSTTSYERIFPDPLGSDDSHIMNNCICNDYVGLCNRYLKESKNTPNLDHTIVNKILDRLANKLKPHFTGPLTVKEFLIKKKGKLGCRYVTAARKILDKGFNLWKDNDITAFIKNEIYDEIKPPRLIMGRNPKFNIIYGCFTTALEHAMQHLPQISKGKNFLERGEQFAKMYMRILYEVDFSKYESTQRYEVLKLIELGLWRRICPQYIKLLENIFKAKMKKKGRTNNGTTFEFWYCRGSGDMDTGLFNTLLTAVACEYFFEYHNDPAGDYMCDGDDNVLSCSYDYPITDTFALFGFEAKMIKRTDYHDVNYCSGKFIQYQPGKFIYVQNLCKLMKNIGIFRKTKFQHAKSTYYHSLGQMYHVMYGALPVFKEISAYLLRSTKGCHVSTEILDEINPMHSEAFNRSGYHKNGYHLEIDPVLCKVELAMCFLGSIEKLEEVASWYRNNQLSLLPAECKRFNASRDPRVKLTDLEYQLVEERLLAGCMIEEPLQYQKMCY